MNAYTSNEASTYIDNSEESDGSNVIGIDNEMSEEYRVEDKHIKDRNGNYIFTVGNVGCGKSTIQSMMIARLWNRKDIAFDYHNNENDHRHDKVLNDMVTNMQRGILPDRTKQGRLQEFSISLAQKGKRALNLNFLEISGEDIKSIVPTLSNTNKPALNSQLVEYLKLPTDQVNKRFLFVSDAEENRKGKSTSSDISEDILFNELLRFLLGKNTLALPKINVFFVVSKWDVVQDEYANLEEYISRNFPQTSGVLKTERCKVSFMPFSVGDIAEELDEGSKVLHTRVKSLNSRYIDHLIQMIYHSFSQNELDNFPKIKRTLWDRMKRVFS